MRTTSMQCVIETLPATPQGGSNSSARTCRASQLAEHFLLSLVALRVSTDCAMVLQRRPAFSCGRDMMPHVCTEGREEAGTFHLFSPMAGCAKTCRHRSRALPSPFQVKHVPLCSCKHKVILETTLGCSSPLCPLRPGENCDRAICPFFSDQKRTHRFFFYPGVKKR